jgi:hypothetical protein
MKAVFLLMFVLCSAANAAVETHVIQEKKIQIDVPKEWETVKDLYGLPLVALGPEEDETRPAIAFSFTGMTKKIMKVESFQKLFTDFRKEKETWVQKHKGKLIKFEEMTPVKTTGDIHGHYIGAEFLVEDTHFVERSYYLYCKDEVYHVKWSMRDEHRKHMKDIDQITRSFSCK